MKRYKVRCPVIDENTPGACSLYAGIEIYEGNEQATPPHAEDCKCYLEFSGHGLLMEENVAVFSTGGEQPQDFPREELPRAACSLCTKCSGTIWIFKGQMGCGNEDCEAFSMHNAMAFYKKKLGSIPFPTIASKSIHVESNLTDEQCEKINKQVREMTKGGDWKEPVFLNVDCEILVEAHHATWLKHKRAVTKKELKRLHIKQARLKGRIRKMEKLSFKIRKQHRALIDYCIEHHAHNEKCDVDLAIEYGVLLSDFDSYVSSLRHLRLYLRKARINAKRITELQHNLKTNFTTILVS